MKNPPVTNGMDSWTPPMVQVVFRRRRPRPERVVHVVHDASVDFHSVLRALHKERAARRYPPAGRTMSSAPPAAGDGIP